MVCHKNEIRNHPFAKDDPRGYKKLVCDERISLHDALAKVGMTLDEVGQFNFGPAADYEDCFTICTDLLWEKGQGGIPGFSGWMGSFFWVSGDCVMIGPNADKAKFADKKKGRAEKQTEGGLDVTPLASDKKFYAARSQTDGVWAASTIDTGFEGGDILLVHHAHDDFISKITVSWPTHAGITLNEMWAVDADNRADGFAVAPIMLEDFFNQDEKEHFSTPHGGMVYRYIGKPGDEKAAVEKVRHDAAVWAKKETWNKYKFVLLGSHIVSKKIGKGKFKDMKVVEKKFDAQGKAVDEKGKRLSYYSRSAKADLETEFQAIYCAEFVWRAYRTGAGVNIVDPKKLTNIFNDSSHAIAAILRWKIADERDDVDYDRDAQDKPISRTAEQLRNALSGWKGLIKKLPGFILRKKVLSHMKKEFNAYLCAPYQLAESKLTERAAVLPPILKVDHKGDPIYDSVTVTDFRKQNVHPYKVLEALSQGADEDAFEAGWKAFEDKKGKKVELSVDKPWADSAGEPSAPELKLDSEDKDKPYNVEVHFTGAQPNPPFM
ncbi:MAG: hypothetical protein JW836_17350 [Deltaproteobacteria bacterium]|nr:hypothetical protein [Deltaproteobacteria bacterium]